MADTRTPVERLLDEVESARLVVRSKSTRRVFVWSGGEEIVVLDDRTCDRIERWLANPVSDVGIISVVTAGAVRDTIAERVNAGY